MTTKPYDWIETVTEALAMTGQIPLWGHVPFFPWDALSNALKKKFKAKSLALHLEAVVPRPPGKALESLGSDPLITPLCVTPTDGTVFWAMSLSDATRLTALFTTQDKENAGFSDERFIKGFYHFVTVQALETLHTLNPFCDLSFTLAPPTALPHETMLSVDIKISVEGTPLWGRILCPSAFHEGFKKHFAHKRTDITPAAFSSRLSVELALTAGEVTLGFDEWERVSEGDLILLDRGAYDPSRHKGTLEVTLGPRALFQARLKEGTLKILDYAFFSEEESYMDNEMFNDDEGEDMPYEGAPLADQFDEPMGEEPEHMWSEEKEPTPLKEIIKSSEVPVTLTVEVGKLNMSLSKLLELKPGNTLELTTRPEDGVSIMMQGKCVAHAELIKMGDALGIKILKLK